MTTLLTGVIVSLPMKCPCYAKFMAIPNYTYLKMKMPGPKGVIVDGHKFTFYVVNFSEIT